MDAPAVRAARRSEALGGGDGRAVQTGRRPLVRRLARRSTTGCAEQLVDAGTFIRLNERCGPNSFLARSDPSDVARVEDRTFICSQDAGRRRPDQQLDGPDGDEGDPRAASSTAAWRGRTMYVIPFSMGPLGSDIAQLGVRDHRLALRRRQHEDHDPHGSSRPSTCSAPTGRSCRACTRSARRSPPAQKDVPWPCNPDVKYIVHFPEERSIWSYGSGYGGNALLGKKCLALRIASTHGPRRGLAGRAHADHGRHRSAAARRPTSPPPSRAPAARPTSPCSSRRRHSPTRAGRSRPSATTSPGSSRATTASSTRSTPRPATSASPPAPRTPPTRRRWRRSGPTRSSPTSP